MVYRIKHIPMKVTKLAVKTISPGVHSTEKLSMIDYGQPTISDGKKLVDSVKKLIDADAGTLLTEVLKKDFIQKLIGANGKHCSSRTKGDVTVKNDYTFRPCHVMANVEWLAENPSIFKDILQQAQKHDKKYATKLEKIILDCQKAAAILPLSEESDELWLEEDFFDPPKASVPKPSDKLIRDELYAKFEKLKCYVEKHVNPIDPKYIKTNLLCQHYMPILLTNRNLSIDTRYQLLADLTSPESKRIFAKHRDFGFLIKELIAFLGTLGIFYFPLALTRCPNHLGIFACPKSEKLLEEAVRVLNRVC